MSSTSRKVSYGGVRRQASIVKHSYRGNKLRRFDDASASFDMVIDK